MQMLTDTETLYYLGCSALLCALELRASLRTSPAAQPCENPIVDPRLLGSCSICEDAAKTARRARRRGSSTVPAPLPPGAGSRAWTAATGSDDPDPVRDARPLDRRARAAGSASSLVTLCAGLPSSRLAAHPVQRPPSIRRSDCGHATTAPVMAMRSLQHRTRKSHARNGQLFMSACVSRPRKLIPRSRSDTGPQHSLRKCIASNRHGPNQISDGFWPGGECLCAPELISPRMCRTPFRS